MTTPLADFPTRLIAGDSVTVSRTFSDVPVGDGWTVTWHVVMPNGQRVSTEASEAAGAFLFALTASDAANLAAGGAFSSVVAVKDTERRSFPLGPVVIAPDPVTSNGSQTELAHVERVIAACEARIEGRVSDDVQMYQLPGGTTVSKMTLSEVTALLAQYRAKRSRMLRGGQMRIREVTYARRW